MVTPGQPITPSQAAHRYRIPAFVIDAVNGLLRKDGVLLKQDDVIAAILARAPAGTTRAEVFTEKWLDFEDVFRGAGWAVVYDKPGYNETYEPTFEFRPTKSRRVV